MRSITFIENRYIYLHLNSYFWEFGASIFVCWSFPQFQLRLYLGPIDLIVGYR